MKNRGIVKIDEVGRMVIPKDVREMLNLNDKLVRVYVDDDRVIIKKYAPLYLYKSLLSCICVELERITGYPCFIGNAQSIVEVSNEVLKPLKGKNVSNEFKKLLSNEKSAIVNIASGYDSIEIVEGGEVEYHALCLTPIKDEFSFVGFFALISLKPVTFGENELNALKIAKQLFLTVVNCQK